MNQPETDKYTNITTTPVEGAPTVGFQSATLSYASPEEVAQDGALFCLRNLDLSFPEGELSIVTGSVGSGKTTLLLSLLGETHLHSGSIHLHSHYSRAASPIDPTTGLSETVAYCSQSAWLLGASIRENITFGEAWDQARYDAVVQACQLAVDFANFDLGDATEVSDHPFCHGVRRLLTSRGRKVGEKGVSCSGGQRARIALARSIYSRSKTILLDDVLSAVDAHTAKHLYNSLKGPLLAHRTCILVTHAVGPPSFSSPATRSDFCISLPQVGLVLPGSAYAVRVPSPRPASFFS